SLRMTFFTQSDGPFVSLGSMTQEEPAPPCPPLHRFFEGQAYTDHLRMTWGWRFFAGRIYPVRLRMTLRGGLCWEGFLI
ncbi:MAG: hypothetical protein ACOCG5_07230, partial [Candidatus Alkaliphilus sp. MAG34]